jgi:hypothetical protein
MPVKQTSIGEPFTIVALALSWDWVAIQPAQASGGGFPIAPSFIKRAGVIYNQRFYVFGSTGRECCLGLFVYSANSAEKGFWGIIILVLIG